MTINLRLGGFWIGFVSTILFHWVLRLHHGPVAAPTWMLIVVSVIHVSVCGMLGLKVYDKHRRWYISFLVLAFFFPLIMYAASA